MTSPTRREFLAASLGLALGTPAVRALAAEAVPPTATSPLPGTHRWRGFNLQAMFMRDGLREFDPWHFDFMVDHGFNFVRFPLDYRIWTKAPDTYDDEKLKILDRGIALARDRNIHVLINLHRAPGYTVAQPAEAMQLFGLKDAAEARRQFAHQWGMLASRYRSIPASQLSFNLVNEPANVKAPIYAQAVQPAIDAIRKVSADRIIVSDGLNYGRTPATGLTGGNIIQATRGYEPFGLTHYKASWVNGADRFPPPQWPLSRSFCKFLHGPSHPELRSPLILRGSFPSQTIITIKVGEVSTRATMKVMVNDSSTILDATLDPSLENSGYKSREWQEQWKNWRGIFDKEFRITLPAAAKSVAIKVNDGDWLTIDEIRITAPGKSESTLTPSNEAWQARQVPVELTADLRPITDRAEARQKLYDDTVKPWVEFGLQHKVPVIVGEWGAFNQSPAAVVMPWMEDMLTNFRQAKLSWALWELEGAFGVVNSHRKDVTYEDYKGRKLHRAMLELLKNG